MTSPDSRQDLTISPEIQATGWGPSPLKPRRPRQYAWAVVVDCGYSNKAIALPRLPEHFHKCSQAEITRWRYPLDRALWVTDSSLHWKNRHVVHRIKRCIST